MSEAKAEKNKKNPLVLIIIVLVLVIIALGAYFMFMKKSEQNKPYVPQPIVEASWTTDEFLVNLADTDSERYLKATIVLTYDSADKTAADDLTKKKDAVRDSIISVLRAQKSTDISSKGTDELKTLIIKKVDSVLGGNKIINVYYDEFLIQ